MIRHTLWAGWWVLILAALMAILLTVIRLSFPFLGEFKGELEQRISRSVGSEVNIGSLETGWRGPFPTFYVSELSVVGAIDQQSPIDLTLNRIRFELNPWKSLIDWAPIFQNVEAEGFHVSWYQSMDAWVGQSQNTDIDSNAVAAMLGLLLEQPSIRFKDSSLRLIPTSGPSQKINLSEMVLESSEQRHQLSGQFWMPLLGKDTQLEFAIQSSSDLQSHQPILPFYLKLNNLGTELFDTAGFDVGLKSMNVGAELWGQLRGAELDYLIGDLQVKDLLIASSDHQWALDSISTQLSVQSVSGEYQLQLKDSLLASKEQRLNISTTAIDINRSLNGWSFNRLQFDRLDIQKIKAILDTQTLSPLIKKSINALDPKGFLTNVSVDLSQGFDHAYLVSDLENVSIESWNGTPMASQLNGLLRLTKRGGSVDIASDRLVMHFPSVYDWALPFNEAKGRVEWRLNKHSAEVFSSHLSLGLNGMQTHGSFSLDLPYDGQQQGFLNLSMGLKGAQARDALLLAPPKIIGNSLYAWLARSLETGYVKEAGLTLVSPMRRLEDSPKPLTELYIVAEDTSLDYQMGWPELSHADAVVHVREGTARVLVLEGEVINSELLYGDISLASGSSNLSVNLALEGSAFELNQLFASDVLKSSVGDALKDWQIAGQHQTFIELDLSLKGEQPSLRVTSELNSGVFASKAQRLAITGIEGQLIYDLSSGLSSDRLKADILGREFSVSLASDKQSTAVSINGRIDSHRLMDWARVPFKQIVRGEIPILAKLILCRDGCVSSLQIESSLLGTEVLAPDYLYHSGSEPNRLSVQLGLSSSPRLQLNYADRLRADLTLSSPLTGHIRIGGERPLYTDADELSIDGAIPQLTLSQTFEFIGLMNNEQQAGAEPVKLDVNLEIDELLAGDLEFNQVEVIVSPIKAGWSVIAKGPDLQGNIIFNTDDNNLSADISHIHFRSSKAKDSKHTVAKEVPLPPPTRPTFLAKLPTSVIQIQSLVWNETEWGRWQGKLYSSDMKVSLDQIQGQVGGVTINGQGQWTLGSDENTSVSLNLSGENMGDYLEAMGDPRAIETKEMSGQTELIWPGAPWSFSKYRLSGALGFDLRNGLLTEVRGGSSLLRLFGILNFNNLFKRLKLDFSDLYKQGVAFDKLVGNYEINKGVVNSLSPLIMRGPSADLTATGHVNLIDRSVDQRLDVILPIAGNTPLAAVLLGAPQIAGALFLIDKLLGDKINEATKLSYRLTGPWTEPELEQINATSN